MAKPISKEAEKYLDKYFPKGKSKLRGEALVLIALCSMKGIELENGVKRIVRNAGKSSSIDKVELEELLFDIEEKKL